MWESFPELGALLRPLLDDKLKPGIVVIASIICIWSIYQSWTEGGERFSWFSALLKCFGVALVAVVAYNAETIINGAIGAFVLAPRLARLRTCTMVPRPCIHSHPTHPTVWLRTRFYQCRHRLARWQSRSGQSS